MTDIARLGVSFAVVSATLIGWNIHGPAGMAVGLVLSLALLVVPWYRQPLWRWIHLYLGRNRKIRLLDPIVVANDRSGGGVRYQDGVAIALVQIQGRAHRPTYIAGAAATVTDNVLDIATLTPVMHHSLGLTVESLSVLSAGSRRRNAGDYPRVYDTFIGPAPYAGHRETWLVLRIRVLDNGDALLCRKSAGTAALAAAQRTAAYLRTRGVRARVAAPAEMIEMERCLGSSALESGDGTWHSVRGESGWLTTYSLRPCDINTASLAQPWTWRADRVVENVTLFPDGTVCASVTVQTPQPPPASPAGGLQTLPGEQARAVANNLCGPRSELHGQRRGVLPGSLMVPVGSSGVLLGKLANGDRLGWPLSDPVDSSLVQLIAEDAVIKRIIIRSAAAGDRITLHTRDIARWDSIRMTHVVVTDQPRPASGTTISVVDGSVSPSPRPNTVLAVSAPGSGNRQPGQTVIEQIGPSSLEVSWSGEHYEAEVEFFRAENRYASPQPLDDFVAEHEMAW